MDIRNNNESNATNETSISRIEELETRQFYSATSADIGINVNDASSAGFQKAVPVLKQMGVTTVRLFAGVDWTNHNFTGVLQRAIDYHNAGFDVMVVVNSNSTAVPSASDVKGWFTWAMTNSTLKASVDRWEIGNEVDSSNYFKGTLQQYLTNELEPAYGVLHAAGEKVVSAGVSWNPADIQTMIGEGLLEHTDYIGFHPYANGVASQGDHITELESIVAGRKPLVASEWNIRGLENNKTAWAQAVEQAYTQVREGFAFNYYFCLFVQNTPAGPGAIMNADGSENTPFWNAVSTFKTQAAAIDGNVVDAPGTGTSTGTTTGTGTSTGTTDTGNTAQSSGGSISGVLWNDDNGNGVKDTTESLTGMRTVFIDANGNGKLDTGEKTTTSNAAGKYSFTGLKAGTYKISRLFPSGYRMSNGVNNDLKVTLNPGQILSNANIGTTAKSVPTSTSGPVVSTPVIGTPVVTTPVVTTPIISTPVDAAGAAISGVLWNDTDGDGVKDANEAATGVRTVFIDSNDDGILDDGERSTQSNAAGQYSFTGLNAGTYHISRVYPSGYHMSNSTSNDLTVTVAAGRTISNLNIGTTDKLAA